MTLYAQLINMAPPTGRFGNEVTVCPGCVVCSSAIGKTLSHDGLAIAGTAALAAQKAARMAIHAVREELIL